MYLALVAVMAVGYEGIFIVRLAVGIVVEGEALIRYPEAGAD
jgi:hypothetical protein